MTGDRVAEIAARLEAATPGPWTAGGTTRNGEVYFGPAVSRLNPGGADIMLGSFGSAPPRDADLIANAPSDLAYLLAEVAALRGRRVTKRKSPYGRRKRRPGG